MLGALIGLTAAGTVLNAASSLGTTALQNYYTNKQLDRQEAYNASEAQVARDFSAEQAEKANAFSAEQAQLNRDWQTEMSNTEIQRRMADLKAAGLNPALAAMDGATVGSGASASAASVPTSQASGSGYGFQVQELALDSAINSAMKIFTLGKLLK